MTEPGQQVADLRRAGNAAFAAGHHEAAAGHYSAALAVCDGLQNPPELHLLFGNRAAAWLKLGRYSAALADAEAALAVDPKWVKALFRKAAALQGLGQAGAAAAAAQQALLLEPDNREVRALLQQLGPAAAAAQGAAAAAGADAPSKPAPRAALLPPLLAGAPWEYAPAADGVDENLLLLLHGLGDRPAAFARLARQMALPQTAALALGGPQEVPFSEGGRSWYAVFDEQFELIQGRPGEERRVRSLAAAVVALQQLLAALRLQCGWQAHRVHLLGFSQGGTVALELARQQQAAGQPLGSCVAVSAALLPEQLAAQRLQQPAAGPATSRTDGGTTPVLITHGSADKVVSRRQVDDTAALLHSAHGMAGSVHSVPGKGHAMPHDQTEMEALMKFWAQHLSRRPTAADEPTEGGAAPGGRDSGWLEVRPGEVSLELVGTQAEEEQH